MELASGSGRITPPSGHSYSTCVPRYTSGRFERQSNGHDLETSIIDTLIVHNFPASRHMSGAALVVPMKREGSKTIGS